jgi:hypothetical protein
MAASSRLMILMSPEERASLELKARILGVSAGGVVRRAVRDFGPGTEAEGPSYTRCSTHSTSCTRKRCASLRKLITKWPRAW